jgi:hypothetical protein
VETARAKPDALKGGLLNFGTRWVSDHYLCGEESGFDRVPRSWPQPIAEGKGRVHLLAKILGLLASLGEVRSGRSPPRSGFEKEMLGRGGGFDNMLS